ncbi:MAG: heme lyase CcmF/NrfE family subunit, partial [Planctomycetota bacterium]
MALAALGQDLLLLAALASGGGLLGAALAIALPGRERLVEVARRSLYGAFALTAGSAACLFAALGLGVYDLDYVYHYSERYLPVPFRLAGLWAGVSGSLLFWSLVLSGVSALAAWRLGRAEDREAARRLAPWAYAVLAAVTGFFILVAQSAEPFRVLPLEERLRLAETPGIEIGEAGNLLDGAGLNQQLVNWWFVVHPPALYAGFIVWTVPFALAVAALFSGEFGPWWFRAVRAWSLAAWTFLTAGIVLGGLWAYRQLGWGGYWAWDPVENASLLPWLTGTGFLHSLAAFERRGRLRLWTASLLALTFYLTIVATWMTRSGVVRSVHAFAGGPIGTWLLAFLFVLAGFTVFAVAYRSRPLAEAERRARAASPESWLSREAAFQVANALFVLIGAAVFALSFLPKISHDFFAATRTDADGALYYRVTTPLFAVLLALAGAGSALGWGRTTGAEFRRRVLAPVCLTAAFAGGLYAFFRLRGLSERGGAPSPGDGDPAAFYPTGLLLALAFFLASTAAPRPPFSPRRLGAQLAHLGAALLAAGIVVSSMFRVTETHILPLGESGRVGPYLVTPVSEEASESPRPGEPYAKAQVLFRVTRPHPGPLPGAGAGSAPSETLVADLRSERRYYPKKDQWASEVAIRRGLWEDVYLYFSGWDAEGRIAFVVYLNPFMALVYLGSFVLVLGGVLAAVPRRGPR